jgi:diadenosine tetraphosphate (Ap4A) HIT family hydrolase
MEWPLAFYQRRSGIGCRLCEEGRPETTPDGMRFHAGDVSDAYLCRPNIQRGLTVVVWRGRHVAEPTELNDEEAARFWHEVLSVGRALEDVLQPVKLNYNLLGNSMPHLHVHIVPRYADDPRPGWPFPFPEEEPPAIPDDVLQRDIKALRLAIEAQAGRTPQSA